ncbi:acyltransferase (plasmid) [Pseudorhodobacter turbinis]|uniref:Acyltransferase n=1 Tax=Pseudorhodobacter turbinis TaxID=2500533 RepID=A0A4V1E186_9RHOB|nr:acyltransferase [Pseudorhodobacter turbinis]QCO57264.1 acyltransferase [Pseudorhodobacter turbinis]
MLRELLIKFLRKSAVEHGKYVKIWRKFGNPSLDDWTEYMRRHAGFESMGDNCSINPAAVFTDPHLTRIGNNVWITGGFVSGHDGSAIMLNQAHGTKFDAVGPVVIGDNVFIGVGTYILPGSNIGPNTIIGAGSVVSGRIEGGMVYAGNPPRKIRTMEEHMAILESRNISYPWRAMIEARKGGYDPEMEPELSRQRAAYFFKA